LREPRSTSLLLPFGYKAVPRDQYPGREDVGTGPLGVIGNIVWLLVAGWWFALGHLVTAILLAVTIAGIPFAWARLKLAGLARSGRSGRRDVYHLPASQPARNRPGQADNGGCHDDGGD
jgi:uncharacterized membrane protein YccF (DUF307 family)